MTNFSPTITSRDEDPYAWMEGFDNRYSSGLTCLTCYAVVQQVKSYAEGHRRWHERIANA